MTVHIDDRTGKLSTNSLRTRSANGLRTDAQRTANTPVGGTEELLLSDVFLLLLSVTEE